MKKHLFLYLFLYLVCLWASAGIPLKGCPAGGMPAEDSTLQRFESALSPIAWEILYGETDSARFAATGEFTALLTKTLQYPGSFTHPFDSLITIARLYAPDSSFRLFNWNLPESDGTYTYYGVIQVKGLQAPQSLFILTDLSDRMADAEHLVTDHTQWYGAHYYEIILDQDRGRTYYTLLGWDGHTRFTTRKIIDVLWFGDDHLPSFGAQVFPDFKKGDQTRIIFEYSSNASMSLKYDVQTYTALKNRNASKPRYRAITTPMIVFDHLEPMDASLEGQYSFYVPVGNIFDAFVFEDGVWMFHPDIDAKNPETEVGPKRKKPVENDLFPPPEQK